MTTAADTMAEHRPNAAPAGKVKHVCADGPHYPPGGRDGPMTCSCGWQGLASAFQAHRTGSGERRPGGFATSDRVGSNEHSWKPEYPPVTRRQGPKDEAAEPVRTNRGFGRSYPTPKEETVTAPASAGEKQTHGECVICGAGFDYRKRGYASLTCSDEHRRERDRRIKRGEDVSLHPKGQQKPDSLAASIEQPVPSTDVQPHAHIISADSPLTEPVVDPMHEWGDPAESMDFGGTSEPPVSLDLDPPEATPLVAAEDAPPPLGDQLRIGGIEIALEEATKDLARLAEVAERADNERDYARVAVSWLRDKLASLQA